MRQTAIQYYTYLAKNALELSQKIQDFYMKEVMQERAKRYFQFAEKLKKEQERKQKHRVKQIKNQRKGKKHE